MTDRAGKNFRRREDDVRGHAEKCDAGAGLEIAARSVRVRVRGHRMSESIKAIVYEAHGKPEEVLSLRAEPLREAVAGEAVVRMLGEIGSVENVPTSWKR